MTGLEKKLFVGSLTVVTSNGIPGTSVSLSWLNFNYQAWISFFTLDKGYSNEVSTSVVQWNQLWYLFKFVSLQLVFKVKLLWLVSRVNHSVNSISLWLTENENAGCLSNNMQGLFHMSPGCLKITGLFLTWVRFLNCGVKQW